MQSAYVHHAETRPLQADDIELILPHLALESERAAVRWRVQMEGPNTAFLIDGQVVAAGGFQLHNLGTGEPWLVITPEGKQYFRPLYRAIVSWLIDQVEVWRLHRLQAIVRHDNAKALTLLIHLGFEYEGTARQFGPDRADYYLYAWVRRS
jgi:hypothetical protein